jgi:ABC-2 type transport system permease protein
MLGQIAAFEIKLRMQAVSTWLYLSIFMLLAYLLFIASAGAFQNVNMGMAAGGRVMINSPHTLATFISLVSYLMILVVASVSGQAVHKDVHHNTLPIFFTLPISKTAYLGGRLLAALALLLLISAGIGVGTWLGSLMPFVDRTMIGPNRPLAYLTPYLTLVLPNLLFMSAGFFGLAAWLRSMRPVYVVSVVMLVGYLIAGVVTAKIENKTLAALLDPFGMMAFEKLTEYWTVAEKNQNLVPLGGVLLANRALWLAAGALVLGLAARFFRFEHRSESAGKAIATKTEVVPGTVALARPVAVSPLSLLPGQAWLAFKETVKNVYFLVIVLAGVLFVVLTAQLAGSMYGTRTYPVTYMMIQLATGGFGLFTLIIVTFYAGELTWRERDARMDQIMDALPIPGWLPFAAKLAALLLVGVVLQAVVMACGIGVQLFRGYTHLELPLYLKAAGMELVGYAQLCALAMVIQAIVNHRYVGYLVLVLYGVASTFMVRFGLEHHLYRYGTDPGYEYSDMNGFGPFLRPWAWFNLYWSLAAVLLALVSSLLWPRGGETRFRRRLIEARRRLSWPVRIAGATVLAAFVLTGAFIFYNTNVQNHFVKRAERRRQAVDYELTYKAHEKDPLPRIEETRVRFDLDPARRSVRVRGQYQVRNKTDQPISQVLVNLSDDLKIHRLNFGGLTPPVKSDKRLSLHTFAFSPPLAPGQTTVLAFDVAYEPRGFSNGGEETFVAGNGSFLNSGLLPMLGYQRGRELSQDDDRRKFKLPTRQRMADLDDPVARNSNYITGDADWISLEITACTSPDQTALAPGQLERRWTEAGRACFLYRSPGKVLSFYSVLSARYQLRRDRWRDVDIEIHHHPGHEYNVDRMVASIKDTLEYATRNFSPYPQKVIRIVEFPRYAGFAQSFPATIPYSESVGFIAEVRPEDPDDIDYPTFITAHEVGHQWWAHQVVGANTQGATLLTETLAEYTGLMVMKHRYGADNVKRFLRYDLDRYLIGRAMERKKELPLVRVEDQGYIHYQKGGLAMYALAGAIGEETVNKALHALVEKVGLSGPPYPTSRALIEELRRVAPADAQELITDLFERITLYENRAERASMRTLPDGRYEVKVTVNAKKLQADEVGTETERPLDDTIEVGVLDEKGRALHLEKQRFKEARLELTMVFASKTPPAKAGIDPMNALIDRKPDDNVTRVVESP